MAERPILFNDAMVRAILDERKTQTRRLVKHGLDLLGCEPIPAWTTFHECHPCPHGQLGDRLWVRECFSDEAGGTKKFLGNHLYYRADPRHPVLVDGGWTPSIHMPRWASRITLEITGVHVERLQAITETDAVEEGVGYDHCRWFASDAGGPAFASPRAAFAHLWKAIYGAGSWDSNPWVWVIEFMRIDA